MTLRIIHTGGVPELVPDGEAFVDTTVAVPRNKQRHSAPPGEVGHLAGEGRRLSGSDLTVASPPKRNDATGQFALTRKTLRRHALPAPVPKRYGPVSLLERHLDQCAWLGPDGRACGRQVAKQSYCPDHYEQSRGRKR